MYLWHVSGGVEHDKNYGYEIAVLSCRLRNEQLLPITSRAFVLFSLTGLCTVQWSSANDIRSHDFPERTAYIEKYVDTHTHVDPFLKPPDYKHLPHAQRVSDDYVASTICTSFAFFAFFGCLLFVPHVFSRNNRKKSRKKTKSQFCLLSGWEALFRFFSPTGWNFLCTSSCFLLFSSAVSCACV